MRTVVVDKIASVTQACGLRQRGARRRRQHSRRGRRGRGRRDPHQQVHLQHARADQRPHGQGRQGRHRRGRARPSQGAVRLLGPRARERRSPATSCRCSTSAACSACAIRSTRTRASPSTAACSACVLRFPVSRRAHRRARARRLPQARLRRHARTRRACRSWRWPAPAWKPARPRPPCAIISRMRHRGLVVDAFKATGVSLRRDILAMEDAGARNTLIFTDFGIVSTTAQGGPGADPRHADRARRQEAGRHRVRAG